MKKKTITEQAGEFMERADIRFRRNHHQGNRENREAGPSCTFCNGYTWGALDGYKAGFAAALRKKRS